MWVSLSAMCVAWSSGLHQVDDECGVAGGEGVDGGRDRSEHDEGEACVADRLRGGTRRTESADHSGVHRGSYEAPGARCGT